MQKIFLILFMVITMTLQASIQGHIYEDVNADGSLEDKIALANVEVFLYKGTTKHSTTTTNGSGLYSFDIPNGDYTIVVNSQTIGDANVWAEQTYAPKGGICSGNSLASAGTCFGGKNGHDSDDSSTLGGAEHIVNVTVNSADITDIDFGFSFNAVTNVKDSGQGSLRQFMTNANEISGENVMKFSPAVPQNEASWWKITLVTSLPTLTDPGTVIDGSTGNDENSGNVANAHDGEAVGIDKVILPSFNKPELEINANNQLVSGEGYWVSAILIATNNTIIKNMAIYNVNDGLYASGIYIRSGENTLISENFIGSRANGDDPGVSQRVRQAITIGGGWRKCTNNEELHSIYQVYRYLGK